MRPIRKYVAGPVSVRSAAPHSVFFFLSILFPSPLFLFFCNSIFSRHSRNTMGSKADDVSHSSATAAVFLDDPPAERKRDGTCDMKEAKDETTRPSGAAGKFDSIGTTELAEGLLFACHRKIPRRPKEDCMEEELRLAVSNVPSG